MKSVLTFCGLVFLLSFATLAFGEVEIREAPLTWKQAALTDGAELYTELCAVCHGAAGNGDGPAAAALVKPVADLTLLAANNNGVFPGKRVENSIVGKDRVIAHGTIDMPIWGSQFEELRPDWKQHRRRALARQRVYNLVLHLESLQEN